MTAPSGRQISCGSEGAVLYRIPFFVANREQVKYNKQ